MLFNPPRQLGAVWCFNDVLSIHGSHISFFFGSGSVTFVYIFLFCNTGYIPVIYRYILFCDLTVIPKNTVTFKKIIKNRAQTETTTAKNVKQCPTFRHRAFSDSLELEHLLTTFMLSYFRAKSDKIRSKV